MNEFTFKPVGYVKCPGLKSVEDHFNKKTGQLFDAEVVVLDEFADALNDVDGFSRVWLIFVFDRNLDKGYKTIVNPRPDPSHERGLFATRSPFRPNPIGLACVEVVSVEGQALHFNDSDILDGTPILDIKPYIPDSDSWPEARFGWLEDLPKHH